MKRTSIRATNCPSRGPTEHKKRVHRSRSKMALLLVPSALLGVSCLLITNRDKDQCVTTADCNAKGGAFAEMQCVQGVCVSGSDVTGCTSNADCLANPDTPNTYCSSANSCVPIVDANCTKVVTSGGKPISPDSIVLGVLAPLTGVNATDGNARVRAVELAHAEFAERAIGIPSASGGAPRPIALVVCDQVVDAEGAARHLAADVKVSAIIGPGFSGTTVKVAKNVTIPAGVLTMSPSATTPDLTTLQDNGLVWRTSSSFVPEAKAYADLLAQFEVNAQARAALGLAESAPIRVAVLAKGDSYGKGLADLLSSTLVFNGAPATANGPSYFARFDLPDLSANPDADTEATIATIVQTFKPHVILAIGTAEVVAKGLAPIEETWITGGGAQPRPFYVFSEGAKLTELATTVAASESAHSDRQLASRVQVFGPRYNDTLYQLMQTRYSAANNNQPMPDAYGVTGSYDAFYLIAYALVASNGNAPTGATIAEGLKRVVPPGLRIEAGPSGVSAALAEFTGGRNIDYDGVTGTLDFDVATGESPGDYNLYCVQSSNFVPTGQYYLASASTLVGQYQPCQ